MTIQNLKEGLTIMKKYKEAAPVVSHPYMIMVSAVKDPDILDADDKTALGVLGWVLHPVYNCYYYPAKTIADWDL